MTDANKPLVDRLRYDCELARQLGDEARIVLPATFAREILTQIEAQAAEIERLRAALKRIAGGWPKPMQLARETLEKKK
jgi:hypothetical protein